VKTNTQLKMSEVARVLEQLQIDGRHLQVDAEEEQNRAAFQTMLDHQRARAEDIGTAVCMVLALICVVLWAVCTYIFKFAL
jgi:hypothetical protein